MKVLFWGRKGRTGSDHAALHEEPRVVFACGEVAVRVRGMRHATPRPGRACQNCLRALKVPA